MNVQVRNHNIYLQNIWKLCVGELRLLITMREVLSNVSSYFDSLFTFSVIALSFMLQTSTVVHFNEVVKQLPVVNKVIIVVTI